MEGRPGALLHVCLLLQRRQPEGDPERREAHGGAERTLCVQVHNLNEHPIPPCENTWDHVRFVHLLQFTLFCNLLHFYCIPLKCPPDWP